MSSFILGRVNEKSYHQVMTKGNVGVVLISNLANHSKLRVVTNIFLYSQSKEEITAANRNFRESKGQQLNAHSFTIHNSDNCVMVTVFKKKIITKL